MTRTSATSWQRLWLTAAAAALVAGCQADGSSESGHSSPTATPSSATTSARATSPDPSGTSSAAAGRNVTVRELTFTPPEGFRRVHKTAQQRNAAAAYELVGKKKPPVAAPILDVFLEKGDVGTAKVRASSIRGLINLQLKNPKIVTYKAIDVRGARGGWLIETRFSCVGKKGKQRVPCHQIDVLVETPGKPQYGLRYFAAEKQYDEKGAERLLSSLRVNR